MNRLWVCIALLAATVSVPAFAKETSEPAVNANTKETFATVSAWVRKEMQGGGRYGSIAPEERAKVESKLDEMNAFFDRHAAVAEMTDADKTALFNDQEEVNAILSKRDGDRIICKNEMPIGSHIPIKTCKTYSQIEAERKGTRQYLDDRTMSPQLRSGN
jgi:hypothetical protein